MLFDALDAQEFDAIYTAKDIGQARAFLDQDPQIDLVLLEFIGSAEDAVAFCGELHQYRPLAPVPVLGILAAAPGEQSWNWEHMPPGVVEWIASPVNPAEAIARIYALLGARHGHDRNVASVAGEERYQYAFDGSLDELALVDPKSGRLLEVNAPFVQRSGFVRAQLLGGASRIRRLLAPDLRSELN